jgi:hypothetical protein
LAVLWNSKGLRAKKLGNLVFLEVVLPIILKNRIAEDRRPVKILFEGGGLSAGNYGGPVIAAIA